MKRIVWLFAAALIGGNGDISIRVIDRLDFKKSIGEKEDDKNVSMPVGNPELSGEGSENVRRQLERAGFIRGKELLIDRFMIVTKKNFPLTNNTGQRINIRLEKTKEYGDWRMNVIADTDSAGLRLDYGTVDLRYVVSDIVQGGFSEIIILKEYPVKQGFNYDLVVYEVSL